MRKSVKPITIVCVADGDTDYAFMARALEHDDDISKLPIRLVKPEELGLKRRAGGGHKTLLKDAGLATIRAAQGFAEGVLVLVDNDGDPRFSFPHDKKCGNCRECDAWEEIEKIDWGQPIKLAAALVYQAIETLLLSTRGTFTPQIEDGLVGDRLKFALYNRQISTLQERYKAFEEELQKTDVNTIKARSYPRIKGLLHILAL